MNDSRPTVLEFVRRALGHGATSSTPPAPPEIGEPIARLVHSDIGLGELFAKRAGEMNMNVSFVSPEDVAAQVVEFLRSHDCKKVALPALNSSPLLQKLNIQEIRTAGIDARTWDQMTLDELYDGYDAAVTDVSYAVAETGTIVVRPSPAHGRGLTLVPMHHLAIVERKQILPDLV